MKKNEVKERLTEEVSDTLKHEENNKEQLHTKVLLVVLQIIMAVVGWMLAKLF